MNGSKLLSLLSLYSEGYFAYANCNLFHEVSESDTPDLASCKVAIVFLRPESFALRLEILGFGAENPRFWNPGIPRLFAMWNVDPH